MRVPRLALRWAEGLGSWRRVAAALSRCSAQPHSCTPRVRRPIRFLARDPLPCSLPRKLQRWCGTGRYNDVDQFRADLVQILNAATAYNTPGHGRFGGQGAPAGRLRRCLRAACLPARTPPAFLHAHRLPTCMPLPGHPDPLERLVLCFPSQAALPPTQTSRTSRSRWWPTQRPRSARLPTRCGRQRCAPSLPWAAVAPPTPTPHPPPAPHTHPPHTHTPVEGRSSGHPRTSSPVRLLRPCACLADLAGSSAAPPAWRRRSGSTSSPTGSTSSRRRCSTRRRSTRRRRPTSSPTTGCSAPAAPSGGSSPSECRPARPDLAPRAGAPGRGAAGSSLPAAAWPAVLAGRPAARHHAAPCFAAGTCTTVPSARGTSTRPGTAR
jgi:hypothetical protein